MSPSRRGVIGQNKLYDGRTGMALLEKLYQVEQKKQPKPRGGGVKNTVGQKARNGVAGKDAE